MCETSTENNVIQGVIQVHGKAKCRRSFLVLLSCVIHSTLYVHRKLLFHKTVCDTHLLLLREVVHRIQMNLNGVFVLNQAFLVRMGAFVGALLTPAERFSKTTAASLHVILLINVIRDVAYVA